MNRNQLQSLAVFALLVAIAAVGRSVRPEWGFTPVAAAALFAGRFFTGRFPGGGLIAAFVPALALVVSNVFEPAHTNTCVALTVLAAMTFPVLLGGWLRKGIEGRFKNVARWMVCVLAPSLVFFLATNFAVWAFQGYYEKSIAGLSQCYAAGVPFYRTMLAGDLFYAAVLFGAAGLAGVRWPASAKSANT